MKTAVACFRLTLCVGSLIVWAAGPAVCAEISGSPESSKISPQLLQKMAVPREEHSVYPVLVYLSEQADLSGAQALSEKAAKTQFVYKALVKTALSTQQSLITWLKARALEHRGFYITNMIAVYGATEAQIKEIAARPDVLRVVSNPTLKILERPSRTALTPDHREALGANLTQTGAPQVWTEFAARGQGIVIAGQDTGVQWDHPALKSSYRGFNGSAAATHEYNWHDSIRKKMTDSFAANPCGYNTTAPCDDDAHGSHTMGSMVGDDGVGNQIGMAPGAKWIACRNMDAGTGSPATYIECFEFFLAPYPFGGDPMKDGDPARAAHVINNSWGCPPEEGCEGTEFYPVLKSLYAAGVMVVASAGNDGSTCSSIKDAPAYHSDVTLSVGAIDHRTGTIASFSSRGPSTFDNQIGPDVSAPGVNIRSSIPGGAFAGTDWSGTSMSGPHVVGAVALLWSADNSLIGKLEDTVQVLRKTATPKTTSQTCGGVSGSAVPNNTYGYGLLNIYNAVKSRRTP